MSLAFQSYLCPCCSQFFLLSREPRSCQQLECSQCSKIPRCSTRIYQPNIKCRPWCHLARIEARVANTHISRYNRSHYCELECPGPLQKFFPLLICPSKPAELRFGLSKWSGCKSSERPSERRRVSCRAHSPCDLQ